MNFINMLVVLTQVVDISVLCFRLRGHGENGTDRNGARKQCHSMLLQWPQYVAGLSTMGHLGKDLLPHTA